MSEVGLDTDTQDLRRSFFGEQDALKPLNYSSRKLEASAVVKSGTGILYGFTVTSTKVSAQFVLVFDGTSVPVNGAVPILALTVATGTAQGVNWIPGRTFFSGIVLVNSSTQGSLTIGSADCLFDAQYV